MSETLQEGDFWLQQQLNGAAAFIALSAFFVTLKFYGDALRRRDGRLKQDRTSLDSFRDGLLVGALIAFIPLCAYAIVYAQAYKSYFASQTEAEQAERYTKVFKMSYAISLIYPVACVLPKLSICCFYLRLFDERVKRGLHQFTYWIMAILVGNAIAWFLPSAVVCYPVSQYWSVESTRNHCIDFTTFGTWISLPHIVTDLVMLVLPIPTLSRLQMSLSKKLAVMFMVLTGSIGIVGACLRLALYVHVTYIDRPNKAAQTTKSIAADTMVSYTEPGMYLIAACLVSLRPIFWHLGKLLSSGFSRISTSGHGRDGPSNDGNGSSEGIHGMRGVASIKHVDMKLTGLGDMQSLVRAGDAIDVGGAGAV